jgi:hypothetical protein
MRVDLLLATIFRHSSNRRKKSSLLIVQSVNTDFVSVGKDNKLNGLISWRGSMTDDLSYWYAVNFPIDRMLRTTM